MSGILNVQVTIPFTAQQICDMFVTAVEGGSNHWCAKMRFYQNAALVSYQKVESFEGRSWYVKVWADDYEPGQDSHTILPENLEQACAALPARFLQIIDESYDAETADCLVQQAAFGEIVYG